MNERVRKAGLVLAAIWIFGGGIWFHIRFALIVYRDRQDEIDALLSRLTSAIGL